ncbi:MAG: hypothetical protein ABID54_09025 [Pseudomonadota bacterium]
MAQIAGIPLPGNSGQSGDLVIWFNSRTLKKKVIENYKLLPILFGGRWDKVKKQWRINEGNTVNLQSESGSLIHRIKRAFIKTINEDYYDHIHPNPKKTLDKPPTVEDGVKILEDIIKVEPGDIKGTLAVIAEYNDPEIAAKLVEYVLITLNEHLSEDTRKTAEINKKFLERQLDKTNDPIVQQKIYNMIAQEIEKEMMSDVKENFGFQVIDPPRIPDEKMDEEKKDKIFILGFVISLVLAIFMVFFLEYVHKRKLSSEQPPLKNEKERGSEA